jgi:arginyl-tRNA synthetase
VKIEKFVAVPAEIDWTLLNDPVEWHILTKFLMPFATLVVDAALPPISLEPKLPEFSAHVIPQFSLQLAILLSSYYGRVKVLSGGPEMYARIRFCRPLHQVINNALRLFIVELLEMM